MKKKDIFESKELVIALLAVVIGIILLETIALLKGVDGGMFGASMTAIGVIGGYILKGFLKKKK